MGHIKGFSPEGAALFAAIRAAPHDDAPWLIYADWLDEHCQAKAASFVRALRRADSSALRPRELKVCCLRYALPPFGGVGITFSLRQIGRRLRVTKERVRQIENRARERLECR
jgi:uncharacterized protein (TIGR02996 family)